MHTFNSVSELIRENWESEEPDKILQALRPMDGKQVTTRILDKLPGGKERWRLRRQYGMTHLEENSYWRTDGNHGISLLMAHTEASFPLNVNELEQKNAAYFSGRRERNHKRMEASHTRELLEKMADAMNKIERAKAALQAGMAEFDALTAYGEPFSQDQYELERACGIRGKIDRSRGEERIRLPEVAA